MLFKLLPDFPQIWSSFAILLTTCRILVKLEGRLRSLSHWRASKSVFKEISERGERDALDGALAVPCGLQPASAGSIAFRRFLRSLDVCR
jgi:hypothetical protein